MITEKLSEVILDNGETVYVAPLSFYARQAIKDRARQEYPDPDPEQYRKPLQNAPEGAPLYEPLEMNSKYQADLKAVRVKRLYWEYDVIIRAGVVVDTPEGQEATIARYAPMIAMLRERTLGMPDDPWLATIMFGLVSTVEDVAHIGNAASDALTPQEVERGFKSFRRERKRPASMGHPGEQVTSSPSA